MCQNATINSFEEEKKTMSKRASFLQGPRKLDAGTQGTSRSSGTPNTIATKVDNLVMELRPHDVIMGRGLSANEYEGNKRLRKMVQTRRTDYVNATSRDGKQNVAREIIAAVRAQGGRFLRRYVAFDVSSTRSVWQSIQDTEEMMAKVKQLFRDMAPEVKKRRRQRRRRRAEWARKNQDAYNAPNLTFGNKSASRKNSMSNFPKPTTQAEDPTSQSKVKSLVVPATKATTLNTDPRGLPSANLAGVVAAAPFATALSSSLNSTTSSIWERSSATSTTTSSTASPAMVSTLTIQDIRRLIIGQQQVQEHQRLSLLDSVSISARALVSTLPSWSSALPAASTSTPIMDLRFVLLELQRQAGAASLKAFPDSIFSTHRVPIAHTLHPSMGRNTANPTIDLGSLSPDELARLFLLERLQNLRR